MNERQFQGRVLNWIADILRQNPSLPFSQVEQEVEVMVAGQRRRYFDLTLYDKHNKAACVFELKLPDRPEGISTRNAEVVELTQNKADSVGAPYFVTWNVNSAVLWQTYIEGKPVHERSLEVYPSIAAIKDSDQIDRVDVRDALKYWLSEFIPHLAKVYTGETSLIPQPLDESFVQTLQSYLEPVIQIVNAKLLGLYKTQRKFRQRLISWATNDQGWTWEGSGDDIERAVRLACNMLANKIVFYEAMRKAYDLTTLVVPRTVREGERLGEYIARKFEPILKNIDYETVFTTEAIIDTIPFASDEGVEAWRQMIANVERYDFTQLPYEVIGTIFQRLIAPSERHKLGQYFTPADVVDLINAFCIRDPNARVLDPGCGAGSFLVRGYSRLKYLDPSRSHNELLDALWGIDIAGYPAHLSVLNLAVRDLAPNGNYPKIVHDDFFKVFSAESPHKTEYPFRRRSYKLKGLSSEEVKEPVPMVDAIVGNPPYTRQEEMEDLYEGMKDRAQQALELDWKVKISGRSSIYAHFFIHGAAFLKDGGYLGLLTSNSWLDVDYGKHLQEFFLKNFKIVAILEPKLERWFPDAAVNTDITILERSSRQEARDNNLVKFVQIKAPLAQLIPQTSDETARFKGIEDLVRTIEKTDRLVDNEFWRISPIRQKELLQEGMDQGEYVGAKWGKYLRAPDVFFKILERGKDTLVRLSEIAEVRRGFTTGANDFFYVKDITDTLSNAELKQLYGLTRKQAGKVRVVAAGDGSTHLIEAEYLKPVIKSPREVVSLIIDPARLGYKVVMVSDDKRALNGKRILQYIRWGEEQNFHQRPTCRTRAKWYGLDDREPATVFWRKTTDVTHSHFVSRKPIFTDQRLYKLRIHDGLSPDLMGALLNFSFTFLCTELWGRANLGEGALDTAVYEVPSQPVLDPRKIYENSQQIILKKFALLSVRSSLHIEEEITQPDRQELDSAVLEALGFHDPAERQRVQTELYGAVTGLVRTRLEKAQSVKTEEGARRRASAEAIAEDLAQEFDPALRQTFPQDFTPARYKAKEFKLPKGVDDFERLTTNRLRIGSKIYNFESAEETGFVELCLLAGVRDAIQIPQDKRTLHHAISDYQAHIRKVEQELEDLASSRTKDRKLKARIIETLRQKLSLPRPPEQQPTLFKS